MTHHQELGSTPFGIRRKLKLLIDDGTIKFGGNRKLKIYGLLNCRSGKRMKTENRVFFSSEEEAIDAGYRPCGHCMNEKFGDWKAGR